MGQLSKGGGEYNRGNKKSAVRLAESEKLLISNAFFPPLPAVCLQSLQESR
jgi:hypothetical protein